MPIFEYYCDMCGKTSERFEGKNEGLNAVQCPVCLKEGKDFLAFKKISKSNFKVNGYNVTNGYSRKT
jgi:putative FmdB family regulatory protein